MDPISQVDQLAMILRQRILDHSKTRSTRRKGSGTEAKSSWVASLKALAATEAVDDHQLRRALIQNILAEQFGHGLVNDTKFQQVVERVVDTLEADEAGTTLMARCILELRNG
ncbi:hypothetical protein [Asticcacaulis solisilvae]|uniref:hypothetical protein n=1 Tax=Asticcacaulis solisilvae TaxID=1217274 RepID=UPI003FD87A82